MHRAEVARRGRWIASATDTSYIEPGSPWENPFAEYSNALMRAEWPRPHRLSQERCLVARELDA